MTITPTPITMDKKYRYRDGEAARILCLDGTRPAYPVVSTNGFGTTCAHTKEGNFTDDGRKHKYDLVEVKPRIKKTGWMNVYEYGPGVMYQTKEMAKGYADPGRIACVKVDIDVEEGEGL